MLGKKTTTKSVKKTTEAKKPPAPPAVEKKVELAGKPQIIPVLETYKLVSVEAITGAFHYFEDEVNKMIKLGWKPIGGIDVKSISVKGWLLTQAMVKE